MNILNIVTSDRGRCSKDFVRNSAPKQYLVVPASNDLTVSSRTEESCCLIITLPQNGLSVCGRQRSKYNSVLQY
jgi:hypothetical protein